MVKAPVKRKQKQKIKQKVKVSQNVKVVIGDVKRKQASKSSGAKSSGSAKPPIVLNISNPQPYNNMFMEYFKNQLQNQQPIQANTLAQQEKINEREETKASKAGALHNLDQDPGKDQERELRRQRIEGIKRFQVAQAEQKSEAEQVRSSLKPVKKDDPRVASTPLRPRQPSQRELLMGSIRASVPQTPPAIDSEMLAQIRQQQNSLENAFNKAGDEGAGAGAEEAKTEVGDWNPNDEQPLSEYDVLYRKPATEITDVLKAKNLDELKKIARQNQVPYNRGGRALNKAELISNLLRHYTTGSPQKRPGRPFGH